MNGLGAGDAFAAGFGYALLRGLDDPAAVANAAGAIVASRHSCSTSMPTEAELLAAVLRNPAADCRTKVLRT